MISVFLLLEKLSIVILKLLCAYYRIKPIIMLMLLETRTLSMDEKKYNIKEKSCNLKLELKYRF